jgi:ABC-type multidrug transport system fused ATPase/permease subunit
MKLLYDSGPLNVIEHIVALMGSMICFALSLLMASIPFMAVAQNGLQIGVLFGSGFALFMSLLMLFFGVLVLSPVLFRFRTRVFLNGSFIEVVRPFPRKLRNQVFDRDRINTIELIHKRKGGSNISILYRFTEDSPSLKDSASIGPFHNRKQAEAVAAAIQSELLPQSFDVEQIEQHERFSQAFVLRFIAVPFFMVLELFVCSSIYSGWNQMRLIDRLVSVFMAFIPVIMWYRLLRKLRHERAWNAESQ